MDAVTAFLRAFDDAWEHKWESLADVLADLGEEEAAWQAPCYRAEPHEEGWPKPGTVWWQVAHVAHCKRYYTRIVRAPGVEERPDAAPYLPVASCADEIAGLRAAHVDQRAAIAALAEPQLALKVGNGMRLDEFLAMTIRHDTWHAAQIAVARRLYRTR